MTTALITGANKGLGKETARLLVATGHTVWLGAWDKGRGDDAADEIAARFVVHTATIGNDGPAATFYEDDRELAW